MIRQILCAIFLTAAVHASGDFVVLHSPETVIFKGDEEIDQSLLKEVFTAALGFTVKQRTSWSGISIKTPFTLPEAVVDIIVEGVDSLDSPSGKRFPLIVDEVEETTWQALSGRIEERDNDNALVRIYLGDGLDALGQSALGELKPTAIDETLLKALSLDNEEDRKFLEEVQLLHAIANKVPSAISADSKPDVYWLVVSGLRPVHDLHGNNSAAVKEALSFLNNAINDISKAFVEAYNGQVLITAFTNNASQVRHTRSIILERNIRAINPTVSEESIKNVETTTERSDESDYDQIKQISPKQSDQILEQKILMDLDNIVSEMTSIAENAVDIIEDIDIINHINNVSNNISENRYDNEDVQEIGQPSTMNLSKKYDQNYPVVFNIILWFCVAFFFSLLAVSITIAKMDPGRDSIIYRMTSNRMKKDN